MTNEEKIIKIKDKIEQLKKSVEKNLEFLKITFDDGDEPAVDLLKEIDSKLIEMLNVLK